MAEASISEGEEVKSLPPRIIDDMPLYKFESLK
jgi:hypothetical protein